VARELSSPWEDFIMRLVKDAQDFGDTSDVFCSGISSITDQGGGVIRVSFYSVKEDNDGCRNQIVDQQDMVRVGVPGCNPHCFCGVAGTPGSQTAAACRRRDALREGAVIEFSEYLRNPCAPTIFVNKLTGIYRVSQNIWKATYALSADSGTADAVETASFLWELHDMLRAHDQINWALKEMQRGTLRIDEGGRRIRAN
jgi:hypothetical protein